MIRKEYRVTVQIPDPVWEAFKDDQRFEWDRSDACKGNLESGTNHNCDVLEWAVFNDLAQAQACERKLMDVMYKYSAKLL